MAHNHVHIFFSFIFLHLNRSAIESKIIFFTNKGRTQQMSTKIECRNILRVLCELNIFCEFLHFFFRAFFIQIICFWCRRNVDTCLKMQFLLKNLEHFWKNVCTHTEIFVGLKPTSIINNFASYVHKFSRVHKDLTSVISP